MNYPIELTFKLLALASQIYIRDANGNLIGYVKQKLFKLKEDINVFADESQTKLLFNIKADRVIDISARYNFTSSSGQFIGSIKRQGMRSIWKAHYEISDANNQQVLQISEENAWTKVFDALVGEVPVVGMFSGYLFNPAYIMSRTDGSPIIRLEKQPAFFESKFLLTPQAQLSDNQESLVLLGSLMLTLMERRRG
ncbi:MAG TPA: hypothetical protein VGP58_07070 [Pyrinomonadaceae bacterium]|jgi:uncharacterized protein YxjI|nr:hypothetical protein [Pyrinomonadaceae bacterium]